ncbi:MAG: efflux RND transporter permease subunit [Chromatiaceae bacterium]|nr:efflux RND transporter permease subunit [Chromatiaceae bacterium]MBP6260802.1 efflux RND transporter permease subunit [Chromatiaceae bacterium]MBP8023788.1 efflux RND transporter permease subunit [Chromatiaceae bacterium]MBP9602472.1 efflux RND transporter permease subunit [Chromatiaceae bacterium]
MIGTIIAWSLRNRFLILLATALIIVGGGHALRNIPLDAIPDLSDVQVIVKTSFPGQAPQVVEDQVTYPITTALRAVTGAVAVRGYSMYGDSYVYVVFRDGTDPYWARSRVLELLSQVSARLPAAARPDLGPDATAVGWVYQYALVDRTGGHDLAQLRSLQDWFLKFELQSLPGVAEVATVGGMVKQYQVVIDPELLRAYQMPLFNLMQSLQRATGETGAGALELAEARYMIRIDGRLRGLDDLRNIPISPQAAPAGGAGMGMGIQTYEPFNTTRSVFRLGDIAEIRLGPAMREGIAELDGQGEVVGGIVLMRPGGNALKTIAAVKEKLEELRKGLPAGVELVPVYDRSGLIHRAIDTLDSRLIEALVVVSLVCALFLWHLRSALVVVISLPIAILAAFIVMYWQGLSANIMSLGGIAIAIGAMVDAAIVMIENLHKHAEREPLTAANRWALVGRSTTEVGPALFLSLIIVTLSFLPVLALQGEEGRLFAPLAYTKTYAMAAAALLSITLVPVLLGLFVRGRLRGEQENPVNRALMAAYRPLLAWVIRQPGRVLWLALALTLAGAWPALRLGSEFMPDLDEGDLLYMPTTFPGIAPDKARQLLQQTDRLILTVPEVARVFGKVGRAETATDPAPMEMIETTIQLKPREQWRPGLTIEDIKAELDRTVSFPGLTNAWLMPINARLQMLSTGIKTPVGVKIAGPDLDVIQRLGEQVEEALATLPETQSVFAERVSSARYIKVTPNRMAMGLVGLSVADAQEIVASAVGGMNITEVVEGRERYPVSLRYTADARDSLEKLKGLPLVTDTQGTQVQLGAVARVEVVDGPDMIRTENARLNGWVYVQVKDRDVGTYVARAKQAVAERVALPPGYSIAWSGAYEHWERAKERLWLVVPLTLAIILLLLYLNFRSLTEVLIIVATLPLGLVGGFFLMYLLGYQLSVAAAIGFIALGGVAVEIGVVMMLYLDRALARQRELRGAAGLRRADVEAAVVEGALTRLRPVTMTKLAIAAALLPIMLGGGAGSEAMQRIAAPLLGGVLSVAILTLAVIPAAYLVWKSRGLRA